MAKKPFQNGQSDIAELICAIFRWITYVCRLLVRGVLRRVANAGRFIKHRIAAPVFRRIREVFYKVFGTVIRDFQKARFEVHRLFYLISRNYHNAKEHHGEFLGFFVSFGTVVKGFFTNKKYVRTFLNYSFPIVAIIMLAIGTVYASRLTYAVSVNYNGEFIGVVENEQVFDRAEEIMQEQIVYSEGEKVISLIPEYTVCLASEDEIISAHELAGNMIKKSNLDIVRATGVYVDDVFFGAVESNEQLKAELNALLEPYRTGEDTEIVQFNVNIEYRHGLYLESSIVDEQKLIDLFTGEKVAQKTYTIQKGDSPTKIANECGITVNELERLNPGFKKNLAVGTELIVSEAVPYLTVKRSYIENYEEAIPYNTTTIEDIKFPKGYLLVSQEGVPGRRSVSARVEYVNGIEVGRTILSTENLSDPIEERVIKGTAEPKPVGDNFVSDGGKFGFPVPDGYVSQEYLAGHGGMDIAAPYGSTIYAAYPGKVIMATWYAGYGNCVQIDHGDGFVTLYGHCSSLLVSYGDEVAIGQPIAAVGSTGWSSGNHCHFEVRYRGARIDPREYL